MNNHKPMSDWLDQALQARFAVQTTKAVEEIPSEQLRQRCREAALGALAVLKMQHHRPHVATVPGSLADHFLTLARLAGVSLDSVFRTLAISQPDATDATNARGLVQLARHLGLARDEALLRLRCGFAQLAGAVLPAEWPTANVPVRGRRASGASEDTHRLERVLRRCEADYNTERRAQLRAAVNTLAEVYEQEMT